MKHEPDCVLYPGGRAQCPVCRASGDHRLDCKARTVHMIATCCGTVIARGREPNSKPKKTVPELQAEAWDEGYSRRAENTVGYDASYKSPDNPYREKPKDRGWYSREEIAEVRAEAWENGVRQFSWRSNRSEAFVSGAHRFQTLAEALKQNPYRSAGG